MTNKKQHKPYAWIPTLYFIQGIPMAVISFVAATMYKKLGFGNTSIAFWISILNAPWMLKPLWAPLLEDIATKKSLTILAQFMVSTVFLLLGFSLFAKNFYSLSILALFLLAFCSATYDIVSDGLYMLNLNIYQQASYVGTRTLFYQLAKFYSSGGILILVGALSHYYLQKTSWFLGYLSLSLTILIFSFLHLFTLPEKESHKKIKKAKSNTLFKQTITELQQIPHVVYFIIFLLFYNTAESQLARITPLFLIDKAKQGGLALSITTSGYIYGLIGTAAIMVGAILGGKIAAKYGIIRCLPPITALLILCNSGYLLLSSFLHNSLYFTAVVIIIAQLGFGISSSSYMAFLLDAIKEKKHKTSLYAFGTALMSLGAITSGSISGWFQHVFGYRGFFIWIIILGCIILYYTRLIIKKYEH